MAINDFSPEEIGRYYDEWTPQYQAAFGDAFQACRPADMNDLHRYILDSAGLCDGERILDAGCGVCGPSLFFAAHRNIMIDAVTVSSAQVLIAKEMIEKSRLSNRIALRQGDFNKLHDYFAEETFDRVLFLESLSHAADPAEPLRSAFRVLKPGGAVYIKDFFEKTYAEPEKNRYVSEIIRRVDSSFFVKTPKIAHTTELLRETGFIEEYIRHINFTNDISAWAKFNRAHSFDLYGPDEPIEWSDWLELRFTKPHVPALSQP